VITACGEHHDSRVAPCIEHIEQVDIAAYKAPFRCRILPQPYSSSSWFLSGSCSMCTSIYVWTRDLCRKLSDSKSVSKPSDVSRFCHEPDCLAAGIVHVNVFTSNRGVWASMYICRQEIASTINATAYCAAYLECYVSSNAELPQGK
jgi:hypothetical protein